MTPRLAPILQDVVGRLAAQPIDTRREDPVAWAYALRDVAALARPAVLVSHLDPALEADALRAALPGGDHWADRLTGVGAPAQIEPTAGAVELVRTLVGAARGSGMAIAATLSGPCSVAARLAGHLGVGEDPHARVELADLVADALASLIGTYADAGADPIIVVEEDAAFVTAEELTAVHSPLVRALGHHRREGVLWWPADGAGQEPSGYAASARTWDGVADPPPGRALRLATSCWAGDPAVVAARWPALLRAADDAGATLLLSDGPLDPDVPPENLGAGAPV